MGRLPHRQGNIKGPHHWRLHGSLGPNFSIPQFRTCITSSSNKINYGLPAINLEVPTRIVPINLLCQPCGPKSTQSLNLQKNSWNS